MPLIIQRTQLSLRKLFNISVKQKLKKIYNVKVGSQTNTHLISTAYAIEIHCV